MGDPVSRLIEGLLPLGHYPLFSLVNSSGPSHDRNFTVKVIGSFFSASKLLG